MLQLQPNHGEAHLLLAEALMMGGDLAAARHHLDEAVRLDPQLADRAREFGLTGGVVDRGPPLP